MTLKKARLLAGYTQTQAAELLEVSVSTIKNWESGKTAPTVPAFERICELYGVASDQVRITE